MKKNFFKIIGLITIVAFLSLSCGGGGNSNGGDPLGGLTSDIDDALFGTWKDSADGTSLTITFSETGIIWGGAAGDSLNTAVNAYQGSGYDLVWIADNGTISYKYSDPSGNVNTIPVYTYTFNSSGGLELSAVDQSGLGSVTMVEDGSSAGGTLTNDIAAELFGTWKDKADETSLTITFSGTGITWGGTVGDSLNTAVNAYQGTGYTFVWIANNGTISYKYSDSSGNINTIPVYTYTFNSGELELRTAGVPGYIFATLVNEAISGGNTYTITFDATDGTGGPASVTATYGSPMPAITPAPTRTGGYSFVGYFDAQTGGTMYYSASLASVKDWDKTSNTTLYAQWANTYTITFDATDGTGGPASVTATYGSPMPAITPAPTGTVGYSFVGYFDAQTGGTMYYSASLASVKDWDKTSNTTLYAQWANTYTITFNATDGTGGPASVTATYGSPMPAITPAPTGTGGYSFVGYFDAQTGGTIYYNADLTSAKTWDKEEDTTLYAQWTNTYTITFDANEGSGGPTTVKVEYGQPMPDLSSQTLPTRAGVRHVFTGYFDAQTGGTKYYNNNLTSARDWDKEESNATLYAQWAMDYEIGDVGPGGGIIFYVSEEGFYSYGPGTAHYLEAAPADMATTLEWESGGGPFTFIGSTGTGIGSGNGNTNAILNKVPTYPAALACRNYNGGGLWDWFLPSKDELNELYKQRNLVGGDFGVVYWSSSEGSSYDAWGQNFGGGYYGLGLQNQAGKYNSCSVRAVRAF